jgi:XRE family transcriptional regulator, regulator of sulfur utilization
MTRRERGFALAALLLGIGLGTTVRSQADVQHSAVFDWTDMTASKTAVGEVRQVLRKPTATLDELEMHITTLNPGQTSHAPHRHPNEELIVIDEGTVEAFNNGAWKRIGKGSIIFNASNELHGIRNVGDSPTTYHVINWTSPK